MFRRLLTALGLIAITSTAAHAQPTGIEALIPIGFGLLVAVFFAGAWLSANFDIGPPPPMTPEQLDQDANRLRALGRHAEATAEYSDKRTRMKLKEEELHEVEEFLAQQRNKRNGNSKHEGK